MCVLHHHVRIGEARRDDRVRGAGSALRRRGRGTRACSRVFRFAFALGVRIRVVSLIALASVGCARGDGRAYFERFAQQRHSDRQRGIQHVRRWLHVVSLSAIPGNAIDADFDFGRISKMGLLQVLGADVEGREFGVGRCCAKSALFHVFNFVI
jgi:hypothetical protein